MIQFSKPKKSLNKAMEQFKRFEAPAMEFLSGPTVATEGKSITAASCLSPASDFIPLCVAPSPSRYDAAYYRTHDPIGYIPPDARSVVSQAYSSSLPMFQAGAPFLPPHLGGAGKRGTYSAYAQSYASQQALSQAGDTASIAGAPSERSSIMSSQWDRLKRRTSAGSISNSDTGDYKTTNDDASTSYAPTSYAQSQAGYTDY